MGTNSLLPIKLPVIDFNLVNLKSGSLSWLSISDQVRRGLEDYGCFVAVCDNIDQLHNKMLESLEVLFDLPMETKVHNLANQNGVCYYGPSPSMPLLEAFSFKNATTLEATQKFTNAVWPAGNDSFCETAFLFSKLLGELAEMVLRIVFEGYGLGKYYESHIASTIYDMAFAKLVAPQMNNEYSKPHSDKSFLTIHDQNHVKCLEIETKDGQWIAFEPAPSHLLVMAGDALYAWSNGRIYSPSHVHGVTTHGTEVNYSASLISFKRDMVQTPEELVDDQHPLLFKPFSNLGYLQYWQEEVEKNPKCSLKDYCGV